MQSKIFDVKINAFITFCKAMTMVRPKTLGEEKEDSEEEEEEIQIILTSKDPNETSGLIRFALMILIT